MARYKIQNLYTTTEAGVDTIKGKLVGEGGKDMQLGEIAVYQPSGETETVAAMAEKSALYITNGKRENIIPFYSGAKVDSKIKLVQDAVNGKISSVGRSGAIAVSNSDAKNPVISLKLAKTQGSNVTVNQDDNGLKVSVDQSANIINIETSNDATLLKKYIITQGKNSWDIDIPKDMVVSGGEIVVGNWVGEVFTEAVGGAGKALKLTIANQSSFVYINVKDLVDVYTGSSSISISDTNVISVKDYIGKTTVASYTVNGKSISGNPVLNATDIRMSDDTSSNTIADAIGNIVTKIKNDDVEIEHKFVTAAKQTDGVVVVSRKAILVEDLPDSIPQSKIEGLAVLAGKVSANETNIKTISGETANLTVTLEGNTIKQGGNEVGTITFPADKYVKSGRIAIGKWEGTSFTADVVGATDKALVLTVANGETVYIDVTSLGGNSGEGTKEYSSGDGISINGSSINIDSSWSGWTGLVEGIKVTSAGTADVATKLGTGNVGAANKGIYLNAGVPTEMTHTLNVSVGGATEEAGAYVNGDKLAILRGEKIIYTDTISAGEF